MMVMTSPPPLPSTRRTTRHPILLGDGAFAAAMSLLRVSGHNAARVYAVDIDAIAYQGCDGKVMTARLSCDDGERALIERVEEGWDVQ